MVNVIPMAGLGNRFAQEGYVLPKPLIPVSGRPMIEAAIRDMPKSDKWVFLVRKEHVDNYGIDKILRRCAKNAIVVPVEKTTEGQACTCMLAMPHIDRDEPLVIASCDSGAAYDRKKYEKQAEDESVDAIVWTFTQQQTLRRNPNAWGWVVPDRDGITIKDVSIKKPVSADPFFDHAVTAGFFFRTAGGFADAVGSMIAQDFRINNEFYVDALPIFLRKARKRSVLFDVDYYIGFGTPKDLYDYQYTEYVFKNGLQATASYGNKEAVLKKYFSRK